MKRVYVAGAINASNAINVLDNIRIGINYGTKLIRLGYTPFVPHLDFMFSLVGDTHPNLKQYRDWALEWLRVSELLLVISGENTSDGVMQEIILAEELDIPIIYGWNNFTTYSINNKLEKVKNGKQ